MHYIKILFGGNCKEWFILATLIKKFNIIMNIIWYTLLTITNNEVIQYALFINLA